MYIIIYKPIFFQSAYEFALLGARFQCAVLALCFDEVVAKMGCTSICILKLMIFRITYLIQNLFILNQTSYSTEDRKKNKKRNENQFAQFMLNKHTFLM